jgi:biopolymer transport protein ExbB
MSVSRWWWVGVRHRQGFARFCLGLWLAVVAVALMASTPTRAQDEGAAEEPAAKAAPAAEGGEAAAVRPKASMLSALLRAHGDPLSAFIGILLLVISIFFFAQVIRFFMEFRVEEAVPAPLVEKVETAIKEKRFQEAYDACRESNSFLARMLRTGIANLPNGRAEAKEAMNFVSEEMVVSMESRISYLATIGTLGPMIGLVGTIWGMIQSFQEIASASGQQPAADKVAGGIATALFITLEGISLSVPAIFFFAFFRNRVAGIAMEATKIADRTLSAFFNAAKQATSQTQPVKA